MTKSSDENPIVPKYLKEDDLGQECKDLIQTLPSVEGWIDPTFHEYLGFWFAPKILQGALSFQRHFQAIDTDIILVTNPKSGTTWLKALTFALKNRNKYPNIHNNHPLLTSNPHVLVPFMEINLYYETNIVPELNSLSPPRIFCTYNPYVLLPKSVKESNCKVVYLCRDPKDTFVSLWHFSNKLRAQSRGTLPLEEAVESFCRGTTSYGPFWDHVLGYWKESLERSEKVMFLKYEEMKMKPNFVLKELAKFLGCPFSKEEESNGVVDDILNLCSFEKLSNLEINKNGKISSEIENKNFFRLGKVGDWKNLLTTEMVEQLNIVVEEKFGKHGLSF